MYRAGLSILLFLALLSPLFGYDMDEIFGPTNINGLTGNGGLSVAFSREGEITLFRWPSPSYYDQIKYRTEEGVESRDLPHFGALENEGSFAGIISSEGVSWFRDEGWDKGQWYRDPPSPVLITWYHDAEKGASVFQKDVVHPSSDILVRHYEISFEEGAGEGDRFIYFSNFSPCLTKFEYLPTTDWYNEGANDFGALFLEDDAAVVHFMPREGDLSILDPLLQNEAPMAEEVESFSDGLTGEGIYIAISSSPPPSSFQVGNDALESCQEEVDWIYTADDAFYDSEDGGLSGSRIAGCQVDSVITVPLSGDPPFEIDIFIAVAGTLEEAIDLLVEAGLRNFDEIAGEAERYYSDLFSGVLPPGEAGIHHDFFLRTLSTIHESMDRETGAIVASVSTQPPYAQDWPRDSAFINLALDLAGLTDLVTKHNLFMADVQRKVDEGEDEPAGTWEMNYYADGMVGGVIEFEIDNTGLMLWSLWNHSLFLSEEERGEYMGKIYPSIRLAADTLATCRDSSNHLQCYAHEDDNLEVTQGLQGAVTVFLGLESAVEAGISAGEEKGVVCGWHERATELKEAILEHLYSEGEGFTGGTGPISWLIYPSMLLPFEDHLVVEEVKGLRGEVEKVLNYEYERYSYIGKPLLSLARYYTSIGDEEGISWMEGALADLLEKLPIEGTLHLGEEFFTLYDEEGIPWFENRVAIPHVWAASLINLTLLALYYPELFDPIDERSGEEFCEEEGGGGCGCRIEGQRSSFSSPLADTPYRH